MRAGAIWLASLVLLPPFVGAPLAAHPTCRRLPLGARWALATACGAVSLSWIMNLWTLAGWRWSVPLLIAVAGLLCFALRSTISREPTAPIPAAPSGTLDERIATILTLCVVAIALVATASGSATSPDLLLFWGPKAQAFARARTLDASFLGAPYLEYVHTDYPPLLPNLGALAAMVAGRFPWGASTLVFPFLLATLTAALASLLRLAAPPRVASAIAALTVCATGLAGDILDIAGNGEMPLILFEVLGAAILIGDWARESGGQIFAGILLAGAVSTKVEGSAFAAAVIFLFLLLRRREIRWPGVVWRLTLPSAACLAAWLSFGASRRLFFGYSGYEKLLEIHWERASLVISEIGKALWSADSAVPYALPLLALLIAPGRSRLWLLPAGSAVLLAGFFFFTYLHGGVDPTLWISWSAGRIFLPIALMTALAAAARSTGETLR